MPVPSRHRASEQTHEPICIVDDDESVADSLKVLLEIFGFDVQSYRSGADFLADDRCRTAGCLVIDQHMPGMNGLDVVDCLQREGIRLPTILISGRLDANTKERAANLGVTKIIDKPFAARLLVELIRVTMLGRN
jgi:FixJ family two-component response regulator